LPFSIRNGKKFANAQGELKLCALQYLENEFKSARLLGEKTVERLRLEPIKVDAFEMNQFLPY
jgi:hypothetical protein